LIELKIYVTYFKNQGNTLQHVAARTGHGQVKQNTRNIYKD